MQAVEIFDELTSRGLSVPQCVELTTALCEFADGQRKTAGVMDAVAKIIGSSATAAASLVPMYALGTGYTTYQLGKGLGGQFDVGKHDVKRVQEEELIDELYTNADRLRQVRELEEQKKKK